jgi:hypothetical protein
LTSASDVWSQRTPDGASAGLFDGADGFRAVGDIRHHHFGALGGQPLAEGLPNPVGPTRDDCALAGRHFRHSPYGFSLVPATWFSALTVNIQKLDNFQYNSRGQPNLSSAYGRAAGKAPGNRSRTWARPAKELGDGVL